MIFLEHRFGSGEITANLAVARLPARPQEIIAAERRVAQTQAALEQFEAALARLEADYELPQAYRDVKLQRWLTPAEFSTRKPSRCRLPIDLTQGGHA